MNQDIKFNYSIINWIFNEGDEQPTGVLLQVDNGDTQYLTLEDYNKLLDNN